MKFARYLPLIAFISCTPEGPKPNEPLQWRKLSNPKLINKASTEKTVVDNVRVLEGKSENLDFKIVERQGNSETVQKIFEGLQLTTKNIFEPYTSPYAGFISKKVECESPEKPMVEVSGSSAQFLKGFLTYANDRHVVETCPKKETPGVLLQAVMGCPGSQVLYEIKIFERYNRFEHLREVFDAFTCS